MDGVLIKDFNTFMYDYTLHLGRKHFWNCCLQVFSTNKYWYVKECFKINGKQILTSMNN